MNFKIDEYFIEFVYSIRNISLDNFFVFITKTGNPEWFVFIILIICMFLYYLKQKKWAIFYGVNILGIWIANELLKQIFKRARPKVIKLVNVSGYSFPSGHTMSSMTAVLLLMYFIFNFIQNKKKAYILSGLIFIYGVLVGVSRVYVGAHYISDVFVGWIMAFIWVFISINIYEKKFKNIKI